jgi:hypothetical protein
MKPNVRLKACTAAAAVAPAVQAGIVIGFMLGDELVRPGCLLVPESHQHFACSLYFAFNHFLVILFSSVDY